MTKTNWHTDELDQLVSDSDNPFSAPVEELGRPIDLRDRKMRLFVRVGELEHKMHALTQAGHGCEIRDMPFTTCLACPISGAGVERHPMRTTCETGRALDRAATEFGATEVMEREQCPELP